MPEYAQDLGAVLRALSPVLNPGVFVYCVVPTDRDISGMPVLGMFQESEGRTIILPEDAATNFGLKPMFRAAWITLRVHTDLAMVGVTAAVAKVLADAGICCNVVAGSYHDHLFVPVERASEAMAVLNSLH